MGDPEVQRSVERFRSTFAFAQSSIAHLDTQNKLQALLQSLMTQQHHIQSEIAQQTAHAASDSISDPVWVFSKPLIIDAIATGAQLINSREQVRLAGSTPLWIQRLVAANEDLQTALATHTLATLERALDRLDRVIDLGSAFISDLLLDTIDDLLRSELAKPMMLLHNQLLNLQVEATVLAEFNALINALRHVTASLSALSADYQGWYGLLSELHFISAMLSCNTCHLDWTWPDISATSRSLIADSTEEWALDMIRIDGNIQVALKGNSTVEISSLLANYLELARKRWQVIIGHLLVAVNELQHTSASLDQLLKTIDSAA